MRRFALVLVSGVVAFAVLAGGCSRKAMKLPPERQLTFDTRVNHDLDNNDNFSPDSKWLVYDTRNPNGIAVTRSIQKVNVETGEIVTLYSPADTNQYGPGVGAASYHPFEPEVVFIHGPLHPSKRLSYQFWRRTGAMIDERQPGKIFWLDARDVTPPFTPGALRGGTHRHEWSGDGNWIGFTYNDQIMKRLGDRLGKDLNLRTIGVAKAGHPVRVDHDAAGENRDGLWFSVLVVKVVPDPAPGSDEISRASGDSWVGEHGFRKPDGTLQCARGFIGKVRDARGEPVDEVFVVDIPEDIETPSPEGPLEGTETTFPTPPLGCKQRRLTHTAETRFPGCRGNVRSAPDGSRLSYLARDSLGVWQVFLISPNGGTPEQLTHGRVNVQSEARWDPTGRWVAFARNNAVVVASVRRDDSFGKTRVLTDPALGTPSNLVWSRDGKLIAFNRDVDGVQQIFVVPFDGKL